MNHPFLALLVAGVACAGCAALSTAPELPPEANRMHAAHAPTPFTAEEIREGSQGIRRVRFRLVTAGAPTMLQEMLFAGGTDEEAEFAITVMDEDGEPLAPPQIATAAWTELQSHASFPADATTITVERRETPLGVIECWLYTVEREADGQATVARFWFDPERPGPPVEMIESAGDRVITHMLMIEEERG